MSFFLLKIKSHGKELMKKFLIVLISLSFVCSVNAFQNDLTVTFDGYLCSNEEIYPVYNIHDFDTNYYFLKPSNLYNFDIRDYSEIPFDDTTFDESIKMYTSYNYLFNNLMYSNLFINKMLWEHTIGDEFYICDKNKNALEYDSLFDSNYTYINELIEGLPFPNVINVVYGQTLTLKNKHITDYGIGGLNQFNFYRSAYDTYVLEAEKGNYELFFELNSNSSNGKIYYDNNNYLLESGGFMDRKQIIQINVDDPTLIINNQSNENINYENICFSISNNKNSFDICSDENGIAKIKIPMGIYHLTINSDIKNDYNDDYITLKEFEQEITINWGEDVIKKEQQEIIEIIPSNTFELKGIIILSFILIGAIIVCKKLLNN